MAAPLSLAVKPPQLPEANTSPISPAVESTNYELHIITAARADSDQVIKDTLKLYDSLPPEQRANLMNRNQQDYQNHLQDGGMILAFYKKDSNGEKVFAGSAMVTKSFEPLSVLGQQFKAAQDGQPRVMAVLNLKGVMRDPENGKGFLSAVDVALTHLAGDNPAVATATARNGSVDAWLNNGYVAIGRSDAEEIEKTFVVRSFNNAFKLAKGAAVFADSRPSISKGAGFVQKEEDGWQQQGLVTTRYTPDPFNPSLAPVAHMRELVL